MLVRMFKLSNHTLSLHSLFLKIRTCKEGVIFHDITPISFMGAAVAEWLSSWLAEQEDWGSIPGLAT